MNISATTQSRSSFNPSLEWGDCAGSTLTWTRIFPEVRTVRTWTVSCWMLHLRKETGHHPNIFQTSCVWKQFMLQMKRSEIVTGLHTDKTQVCLHLCAQLIFTFTYCVSPNVHSTRHIQIFVWQEYPMRSVFRTAKKKNQITSQQSKLKPWQRRVFLMGINTRFICFTYNQHPGFEKRGQSAWRTSAETWTVWHVKTFSEHLVAEKEIKTTAQRWS